MQRASAVRHPLGPPKDRPLVVFYNKEQKCSSTSNLESGRQRTAVNIFLKSARLEFLDSWHLQRGGDFQKQAAWAAEMTKLVIFLPGSSCNRALYLNAFDKLENPPSRIPLWLCFSCLSTAMFSLGALERLAGCICIERQWGLLVFCEMVYLNMITDSLLFSFINVF